MNAPGDGSWIGRRTSDGFEVGGCVRKVEGLGYPGMTRSPCLIRWIRVNCEVAGSLWDGIVHLGEADATDVGFNFVWRYLSR